MDGSLSTDESSATDEEGGRDDFATLLRKTRAAAGEDEEDQTSEPDNSVLEVRDPDTPGRTRSSSARKEGREDARNNNLARKMEMLQDEVQRMKGERSMATAIVENSQCLKEIMVHSKRERETEGKKERPDPVKMEVWSTKGEELLDNNHDVLAWTPRRLYRQPNQNPQEYWKEAKYPTEVKPNLRGGLFLRHLMPLTLSGKAIGWGHDRTATTSIKYYTHSQSDSAVNRKKKSRIEVEEDGENVQSRVVSVGQEWNDTSGITEVVEATHNWAAIKFMTCPWDWSGLLLLRILHDASFFGEVTTTEGTQKELLERFVNEFMMENRHRAMNEQCPMVYEEAVELAQRICRNYNGRQDRIFMKANVYSATRLATAYKEERDKAREELKEARQQVNRLSNTRRGRSTERRRSRGRSPRRSPTGRGSGRKPGLGQAQPGDGDREFKIARGAVCRQWNTKDGCKFSACTKDHKCNAYTGPGQVCKGGHKGYNHK